MRSDNGGDEITVISYTKHSDKHLKISVESHTALVNVAEQLYGQHHGVKTPENTAEATTVHRKITLRESTDPVDISK